MTGIANPRGLYQLIHEWEGQIVHTLEFPDHHFYSAKDWQEINRMARMVDLIVTTEKDILKLIRFPFANDKLLALRVGMEVAGGVNWSRRWPPGFVKRVAANHDTGETPTGGIS